MITEYSFFFLFTYLPTLFLSISTLPLENCNCQVIMERVADVDACITYQQMCLIRLPRGPVRSLFRSVHFKNHEGDGITS